MTPRSPLAVPAALLERNDMQTLGIEPTSRLGRAYSRRRNGRHLRHRMDNADRHLALLDAEVGAQPVPEMRDGYALDTSASLPHLDALLEEMEGVIAERGLTPLPDHGKPFLRDILPADGVERHPSILDFIASPQVLATVSRYVGWVPPLSGSLPPGVRLMESTTKFDPAPNGPWRSSQLWHLDYHATPTIYVIVAIREITPDDGPLWFLGESASRRIAEALDYGTRGAPYRVADERLDALVEEGELQRFCGPAGSVLFVDSSRCFHFGSRNPKSPRYHMQYAYVSPIRNDFGDVLRPQRRYPTSPDDPPWRRLALDQQALI